MKKDTFTVGQLILFSNPFGEPGKKKHGGYITSLPEDNDLYAIRLLGTCSEIKVPGELIKATQISGCTMYHELFAIL